MIWLIPLMFLVSLEGAAERVAIPEAADPGSEPKRLRTAAIKASVSSTEAISELICDSFCRCVSVSDGKGSRDSKNFVTYCMETREMHCRVGRCVPWRRLWSPFASLKATRS